METVAILGSLAAAYLVTRDTRRQVEAFTGLDAMAADSTPAGEPQDNLVTPVSTQYPDRDSTNMYESFAGPPQLVVNQPQNFSFVKKESLARQDWEMGTNPLLFPLFSRTYEKDRLAVTSPATFKDFRDQYGNIQDNTPMLAPKQTAAEAAVEQFPVARGWELDPHTVRVNDDENPRYGQVDVVNTSSYLANGARAAMERPKMITTLRRRMAEENTELRPVQTSQMARIFAKPELAPMSVDRDTSTPAGTDMRTHAWTSSNQSFVQHNLTDEYYRKNEYEPKVMQKPQQRQDFDGTSGLEAKRSRNKRDTYTTSGYKGGQFSGTAAVPQTSIENDHFRQDGIHEVTRAPDYEPAWGKQAYARQQYEARRPGLMTEGVAPFHQVLGEGIRDMLTKPFARGMQQGAAVSSSISDNIDGDNEQYGLF